MNGINGKTSRSAQGAAIPPHHITGVVLAGGRARRMGGVDKGLLDFEGRPLVAYALDALAEVAGTVLVNANRNLETYASLGFPVVGDRTGGFEGPLAGLLSAMEVAHSDFVMTVPCDCPGVSAAGLARLCECLAGRQAEVCVASDGLHLQPVFLLAHRRLAADLASYLDGGGRKVREWLATRHLAVADCSEFQAMFVNINTPAELAQPNWLPPGLRGG